jgi:tetratricopeptide (TPR) repeat protein
VRGGLLVAVSLGWLPNAAGLAYAEKSRLMTLGKTLWLPLWLDGKSGFEKSWSAGFRRMRKLRRAKPLLVRALDKEQGGGAKPLVDDALQSRVRKICDDVSGRIVKRLAQQGAKLIKDAKLDKAPLSTRLKVAKKLLRLRLVARAIPLLEGYLVVNEKDRTAHLLLGVSYAYQGAFALARRHFAKAKSRQARINDALMQALIGQRKTALIALRRLGARKEALALIHAARGSDPQADALARIAGATNLRTRERLLGHRTVKRRVVRRGLDLLKF